MVEEQRKSRDRSDYFLAQPDDFIFHGKRDKKVNNVLMKLNKTRKV